MGRRFSTELRFISALDEHAGHSRVESVMQIVVQAEYGMDERNHGCFRKRCHGCVHSISKRRDAFSGSLSEKSPARAIEAVCRVLEATVENP